jgi:protein-S-isoprenylcysteine O-methyltransferase Ste14
MAVADERFRFIVAALLIAFVAHRGFYTQKLRQRPEGVKRHLALGRGSRVAGLLALPALVASLLYVVAPSWMAWSAFDLPLMARWFGVATALAGFVLLQWSQQTLSTNWSDAPALLEGQELIVRGPYRWIRHPIYAAFLLILGSLLLVSANWFVGGLWILMTALDVVDRMNAEETMLMGQFGEKYRAYAATTGRLFVRVSSRSGPGG